TSLFRKELQIQKTMYVLTVILCAAGIVMALARTVDDSELLSGMTIMPIAVLAFIIPFLGPGGCISEERSWGVSGWQLALPVSSRKQWAAKMATVVFTCVLLGIILPACLWMVDGWVFRLPFGPGPIHWDRFTLPTSTELYWF